MSESNHHSPGQPGCCSHAGHSHDVHDGHHHGTQGHRPKEHVNAHDHGNPFSLPFLAISIFTVVEFVGGWWTQSLALLSDAWHMLFDVLALGLAMWAAHQAQTGHPASKQTERRVSMINAVSMLLVTGWIVYEAIERLQNPRPVAGGYVSIIALVGLLVNLVVAKHMHHQHHHHGGDESLNHRAAFLHVLGDLLGSVAAVVAGVVIYFTGWMSIDPILSILISVLLLVVTLNLIRDIVRGGAGHHH
ncbi:cation diffusion facilitator family transporter [Methylophilus aquaticus]|uniref:Cation diffusion facilitator family transporter n=1 Tax=Methylophilus aquaticus TaxID=1971610 RepID=A0ABT9JU90_9PROT|nr:cation diffusion facilitator family transporter [Methylophilus aquaticus]MDP8568155.1 cation diffusion facilitator family transporter [Methylophilus aquaticus]